MAINKHESHNPEEGVHKYGKVRFADHVNNKYPVDTPGHIHAAWSYIHQERNGAEYTPEALAEVKNNIKSAAREHGLSLKDHDTGRHEKA